MGTRSRIIAKLSNGKRQSIYCHWDGYPEHNGQILNDHYKTQDKVDALIALGDLSSLGEEIGQKHNFDGAADACSRFAAKKIDEEEYKAVKVAYERMCNAYGRDRGEKGTQARSVSSVAKEVRDSAKSGAEFVYIWTGKSWNVTTPELGLPGHDLAEFMKGGLSLVQTVKAFGGDFQLGTRVVTVSNGP